VGVIQSAESAVAALPPDAMLALADPVPVFQPIIGLATGLLTGYEALARFPRLPGVPVQQVFEAAHAAGRGFELEVLALSRAIAVAHLRPEGAVLSVNLSPSALCHPHVLRHLPDDLRGFQVEITEHEVVDDPHCLQGALAELHERGALIAIDDVGEGYAGLRRVMEIRPDVLKLDRGLVSGIDQQPQLAALLESVVKFAEQVGAEVCAEGIETAEELALLADLDVAYGQGWYAGRPAPGFEPVLAQAASGCAEAASHAVAVVDQRGTGDLLQALHAVATAEDLPGLARVMAAIAPAVGADSIEVSRLDHDGRYVEAVRDVAGGLTGVRFHLDDLPLTRKVIADEVAGQVVVGSADADPDELAWMAKDGVGSLLMLPVRSRDRVVGLFECHRAARVPWRRSQVRAARQVAAVAGPVLENLLRDVRPA
jgi:EAL domain-containing protein (putative c-di-GMP-specific phosphodiesterase class I)